MIFPTDLPPLRTTICLPTYNERDNVEPMLDKNVRLAAQLTGWKPER